MSGTGWSISTSPGFDRDHADAGLEFLREFARTDMDLDLVVRTVRDAAEVNWWMFDDIHKRIEGIR